ncbi:PH domain-containing protein [bacterium]|nr:PH domain-containing protein [bacterium]
MSYDPVAPFEDRPTPSWGLVVTIAAGTAAAEGTILYKGRTFEGDPAWFQTILLSVLVAAAAFLYCMFHTRYRVSGGVLELSCGPFRRRERLDEIEKVELLPVATSRIRRIEAVFPQAFCNRYDDCLRLSMDDGREVHLTPSDPVAFARRLGWNEDI